MGMFDYLIIDGVEWQTKGLDPYGDTYKLERDFLMRQNPHHKDIWRVRDFCGWIQIHRIKDGEYEQRWLHFHEGKLMGIRLEEPEYFTVHDDEL